ncbi:BURP domain-containing protein BNM2A [Manihot esculenta]|uniref:BURP domain-containing protein n=1 Tax=Manihot esculenta TaxID=3983 RepID=A0A2C9W1N9_MANES|nr:BURP domain-containing protein BNM2A [Manihot esculenta]OAY52850.1 hypothetical protein MANES_04G116200v8 [Manihot esculenta]
MALRFVSCFLLFNVLLLLCGHHASAVRDVTKPVHFHSTLNDDVLKKDSLQSLYYKILDELFKNPTTGLPGPPGPPGGSDDPPGPPGPGGSKASADFADFVFDYIEPSYIGLFTPDQVYSGKIIPIYFPIQDPSTTVLPFVLEGKEMGFSISHSPSHLPNIFKNMPPKILKRPPAYDICDIDPDETKICAKDIESTLEFIGHAFDSKEAFKILGTKQTLTTAFLQEYFVSEDPQEIKGSRKVICHPMYGSYYCHYDVKGAFKVLKVLLDGESGDKVEAIAVCHLHTHITAEHAEHPLYRMLGLKPGMSSVCHILAVGNFVLVQT